jgi:hypothetical protein
LNNGDELAKTFERLRTFARCLALFDSGPVFQAASKGPGAVFWSRMDFAVKVVDSRTASRAGRELLF